MKKLLIIPFIVLLAGCQSTYLTHEGERLVGNTVIGCALGEVFFDNCAAGAAVTGAATVIDNQN